MPDIKLSLCVVLGAPAAQRNGAGEERQDGQRRYGIAHRANSVGGSGAGRGSSIAPRWPKGMLASTPPRASITAEMPVGVARSTGSPSSIARIRACARCCGGPHPPNQASSTG